MGNRGSKNRIMLEIRLPQLALSLDVRAEDSINIMELETALFKRLELECTGEGIFSMLSERELNRENTLYEEGIKNGDKLIILYSLRKDGEGSNADSDRRLHRT